MRKTTSKKCASGGNFNNHFLLKHQILNEVQAKLFKFTFPQSKLCSSVAAQKAIGNGKENKLEKYKFTEVEMLE